MFKNRCFTRNTWGKKCISTFKPLLCSPFVWNCPFVYHSRVNYYLAIASRWSQRRLDSWIIMRYFGLCCLYANFLPTYIYSLLKVCWRGCQTRDIVYMSVWFMMNYDSSTLVKIGLIQAQAIRFYLPLLLGFNLLFW